MAKKALKLEVYAMEFEDTFSQEDRDILEELRNNKKKSSKEGSKRVKVKITESYFELPNFVPARDGKGWVLPNSRKSKSHKKIKSVPSNQNLTNSAPLMTRGIQT